MAVILGALWNGINRAAAPHALAEGELADASDAALYQRQQGALGPRNGRKAAVLSTDNLLGVGVLVIPEGRYRITMLASGSWSADAITWPEQVTGL